MSDTEPQSDTADVSRIGDEWNVWVRRFEDGRKKDRLTMDRSEHAADVAPGHLVRDPPDGARNYDGVDLELIEGPAPPWLREGVEYLGTFREFSDNRENIGLDLRERVGLPSELVWAIGEERFWNVVRNRKRRP